MQCCFNRKVCLRARGAITKALCPPLPAGPIGLYALSCVKHLLPPDIFWTLVAFLQVVGLLWCKVLYAASIPTLRALMAECVCRIEKCLPISERDIKLHLLADMVDSIENWGELAEG